MQLHPSIGRTANAALVGSLLAAATVPEYRAGANFVHNDITTANASLFTQAHFSEPMTNYAVGWNDPAGYDAASEFLAPAVMPTGELFEYITYPNAEAFLSDDADDDLRAIGGDFKTVEFTAAKERRAIPNRGLRVVVDFDQVKNTVNWQQMFTARLMQRIARNAFRRKYALAVAAGTAATLTWDVNGDPDLDLAIQAKYSGDSTGISPNRCLWGQAAKLNRYAAYGAQNNARGYAGRGLSAEDASTRVGLQAMVDESRYQSGVTKTSIVGSKVVLFNAQGMSGEDSSNFKTARAMTSQGGRFAVYVRQLTVKFWEIVVECYETEWCATTLGCRTLTITGSIG